MLSRLLTQSKLTRKLLAGAPTSQAKICDGRIRNLLLAAAKRRFGWRESSTRNWSLGALAFVATAAVLFVESDRPEKLSSCEMAGAPRQDAVSSGNRPRKLSKQAQNVMIHSRRSLRARTLDDKYNIDWETVIGEGAYGSVHPGRLAATGEKVRSLGDWSTCSHIGVLYVFQSRLMNLS